MTKPLISVRQLAAIGIIFCCTAFAWMVLVKVVHQRTFQLENTLRTTVEGIWGEVQKQPEPLFIATTNKTKTIQNGRNAYVETTKEPVDINTASDIAVKFSYEPRKKGLLWYNLYKVDFTGTYTLENPTDTTADIALNYQFPSDGAIYDNFAVKVGEKDLRLMPNGNSQQATFSLAPKSKNKVTIQYKSQGMDQWQYIFNKGQNSANTTTEEYYNQNYKKISAVSTVNNFRLVATTDFNEVDFLADGISPTEKAQEGNGWKLTWKYDHLISGQNIGIAVPQKLNPGPFVEKVTTFAPVSLFFFFFIVLIIGVLRKISFHPMHFFFIATSFFAFHLLFAYLVDHIDIQLAFIISAFVSIFLNVSYLRLVVGMKFAFIEAAISQLIYLIAFTYSFFFEGYTGLIVVVLSIITLFITMQLTGRLNWSEIFQNPEVKDMKPEVKKIE